MRVVCQRVCERGREFQFTREGQAGQPGQDGQEGGAVALHLRDGVASDRAVNVRGVRERLQQRQSLLDAEHVLAYSFSRGSP